MGGNGESGEFSLFIWGVLYMRQRVEDTTQVDLKWLLPGV